MYRRFTRTDRLKLESLYNVGVPVRQMANELGFHVSSIYRELKRGMYPHMTTDWTYIQKYSADKAQGRADYNATAKGPDLKIGNDRELLTFIDELILHKHYSPDAVLGYIKAQGLQFRTTICTTTLYRYIRMGLLPHVTDKDLLFKGTRKRQYRKVHTVKRAPKGDSIERRPREIDKRQTFGHWELDSVIGQQTKGQTLLVLTERLTRQEIIFKANDKTAQSTVAMLDKLERRYGADFSRVFKTITVDNGCEFQDCEGMQRSILRPGEKRTHIYYCHPYCSGERGSNEKQNSMIRRWIPKGTRMEEFSQQHIDEIADWMNHYPRRLFGFISSAERFSAELQKLNIAI